MVANGDQSMESLLPDLGSLKRVERLDGDTVRLHFTNKDSTGSRIVEFAAEMDDYDSCCLKVREIRIQEEVLDDLI